MTGPVVAHAAMPFARSGSAVTNVIRHLAREYRAVGGTSLVALSDNRQTSVTDATELYVDHTRFCPRQYFSAGEMRRDHIAGALLKPRPYTSRLPIPSIEAIAHHAPDVVIVHEAHYALSAVPRWRKALPNARIFAYLHAKPSRSYLPPELYRLLAPLDGVICVSEYMARLLRRRAVVPSAPVHVVLNGTEPSTAQPPSPTSNLRVLFIGQMAAHKGPHLLVDAAVSLIGEGVDIDVRLIGSSVHGTTPTLTEYEKALRSAARPASSRIQFLPFQDPSALVTHREWADVIVVPSIFQDPCPLALLEALSARRAIIATRRGGIPEIGATAVTYVDHRGPEELTSALRDFAASSSAIRKASERALARASELTWSRQHARFLRVIAGNAT